jgi:hypothetical protein
MRFRPPRVSLLHAVQPRKAAGQKLLADDRRGGPDGIVGEAGAHDLELLPSPRWRGDGRGKPWTSARGGGRKTQQIDRNRGKLGENERVERVDTTVADARFGGDGPRPTIRDDTGGYSSNR